MTHASSLPIAYVETNWVVACVVTHDKEHKRARQLLKQAQNGKCEIRIPLPAVLESKHSVGAVSGRLPKQITDLSNTVGRAFRNGETALQTLQQALESPAVKKYTGRDIETERVALLKDPSVVTVSDSKKEAAMLKALHPSVRLGGVDLIDYYILASVLVDRASVPERPAFLFSTNESDLKPGAKPGADGHSSPKSTTPDGSGTKSAAKLDWDFYDQHRMVYRSDFQLVAAMNDWTATFGTATTGT